MDDQVKRAIARWPDVPAAFGWLRLDRRGRWYLIDRNQPGFDEQKHGKGSEIKNDALIEFIARNYSSDEQGRWFWQNGPQQAFANLDAAPLILRVMQNETDTERTLVTHTGYPISQVTRALIGPDDGLYLATDLGAGCVHDLDLASLTLTAETISIMGRTHQIETTNDVASELGFIAQPN